MPIMSSTRDPSSRAGRRPAWAAITMATNDKISKFKRMISGLALKRVEGSTHMFERIGIFHSNFNSADEPAATWFDGLSEEHITIY